MAATGESVVEWRIAVPSGADATVTGVQMAPAGSTGGPAVGDPLSAGPGSGALQIVPGATTTATLTVTAARGGVTLTGTGTVTLSGTCSTTQSPVDYARQCDGSLLVILRNDAKATGEARLTITAKGSGREFTQDAVVAVGDETFVPLAADVLGSVRVTSTRDGSLVKVPPRTCRFRPPAPPATTPLASPRAAIRSVSPGSGDSSTGGPGSAPDASGDAGSRVPPAPRAEDRPTGGGSAGVLWATAIVVALVIGVGLFVIWKRRQRPAPATAATQEAPATDPPATDPPATDSPDTDSPDTDSPTFASPAMESPDVESTSAESPSAESPSAESRDSTEPPGSAGG